MNLIVTPIASSIGHVIYWLMWLIVIGSLAIIIEKPKTENNAVVVPLTELSGLGGAPGGADGSVQPIDPQNQASEAAVENPAGGEAGGT